MAEMEQARWKQWALHLEVAQVGLSQGLSLALSPCCSCVEGPSLVVPGGPVPARGAEHCDCLSASERGSGKEGEVDTGFFCVG